MFRSLVARGTLLRGLLCWWHLLSEAGSGVAAGSETDSDAWETLEDYPDFEYTVEQLEMVDGCDFQIVDGSALGDKGWRKLFKSQAPALITNVSLGAAMDIWPDKAQFLEKYGYESLMTDFGMSTAQHGVAKDLKRVMVNDYVAVMPQLALDGKGDVIFDKFDQSQTEAGIHRMQEDVTVPEQLQDFSDLTASISYTGAGLPFHQHAAAWLGLAVGRKRWFVFPQDHVPKDEPVQRRFFTVPPNRWLGWYRDKLPEDSLPIECTQQPGQIVYVPERWWHATMNLGDVLAAGGQLPTMSMDPKNPVSILKASQAASAKGDHQKAQSLMLAAWQVPPKQAIIHMKVMNELLCRDVNLAVGVLSQMIQFLGEMLAEGLIGVAEFRRMIDPYEIGWVERKREHERPGASRMFKGKECPELADAELDMVVKARQKIQEIQDKVTKNAPAGSADPISPMQEQLHQFQKQWRAHADEL